MGDTNLDFSRNKRFLAIPYGSAIIGGALGLKLGGAATLGGYAATAAIGAVAGGIFIPTAVVGIAVLSYVLATGIKETLKAMKKEGATVPLGMAIVAMNCAKALFVTPVQAAVKLFKGFGKKPEGEAQPAAKNVVNTTPSQLTNAKAAPAFNAQAAEMKPADSAPENKPAAPKPPVP